MSTPFKPLLIALTAAAVLLGACVKKAPDGVYQLTYATPYPPSHPFSRADIDWMKWIEAHSGGKLKIKPFWADGLISSDESMIELRHGVADIGLITPIYERGGEHMLRIQSGFYGGISSVTDQVKVYNCLAAQFPEFTNELKGLHVLAVQGGNLPALVTRNRPIRSLDDLRGMRLRAPTENIQPLRDLGADPVNMPMNDVYPAMAKGVLDGVVAPGDTLKTMHFAEVAHYYTALAVARGAYPARAISNASYQRLPADLRALLDRSRPIWEAAIDHELNGSVQQGIDFGRKSGVDFLPISPADQDRWDQIYAQSALASARDLSRYGMDGEPVFRRAQAVIADLRQGRQPACVQPPIGS